jgi:hypothetical protein
MTQAKPRTRRGEPRNLARDEKVSCEFAKSVRCCSVGVRRFGAPMIHLSCVLWSAVPAKKITCETSEASLDMPEKPRHSRSIEKGNSHGIFGWMGFNGWSPQGCVESSPTIFYGCHRWRRQLLRRPFWTPPLAPPRIGRKLN